jgi:hypothetical protein
MRHDLRTLELAHTHAPLVSKRLTRKDSRRKLVCICDD